MAAKRTEQVVADNAEAKAASRYIRQRQFAGLLGEAIARADAMSRLEAALRFQPTGR
jgi:hypothetical protein